MNKKLVFLLIILIFALALTACRKEKLITSENNEFDFFRLNDLVFNVDSAEEFAFIEGNNIAEGDYIFSGNTFIIKKEYLAYLAVGEYTYTLYTTNQLLDFNIKIKDQNNKHRIINGGFETGDLFGWQSTTIFKGEENLKSFIDKGVQINDTYSENLVPYEGDGRYVYGICEDDSIELWTERMGIMRSSTFELSGSGYITYKLGAAANADLCYISIRNALSDIEVARYSSQEGSSQPTLIQYKADLTSHIGETLYIEVCDFGGRKGDYITVDSFQTYYEITPQGTKAIDIKPKFSILYPTNQLPNGDFSDGLSNWTVSQESGWQEQYATEDTFVVEGNILKSNGSGDLSRGLIRSALFRVDGCGIISFKIGAAQGQRYDKDTFISIKEKGTNRELYRIANTNHNGVEMVKYYVDLSVYFGKSLYFEIVDNGKDSYDTIFVSQIVTYYKSVPDYDYSQSGINLNY